MIAIVALVGSVAGQAPAPPPAPLDWSSDDSARIAYATAHGNALRRPHAVIWAPPDSLDQAWLAGFADSLDRGLAHMIGLMGGPYPWQRMKDRAPYLHEGARELLSIPGPFYPFEQGDSTAEEAAAATFPCWLSEGLPDVLAQTAARATGFREGDVFSIGGLANAGTWIARLERAAGQPLPALREDWLTSIGAR